MGKFEWTRGNRSTYFNNNQYPKYTKNNSIDFLSGGTSAVWNNTQEVYVNLYYERRPLNSRQGPSPDRATRRYSFWSKWCPVRAIGGPWTMPLKWQKWLAPQRARMFALLPLPLPLEVLQGGVPVRSSRRSTYCRGNDTAQNTARANVVCAALKSPPQGRAVGCHPTTN